MSDNGNLGGVDYVHPTPVTAWQLIGGVVSIVAIMVVSMWTIVVNENANNKAISDDQKNNYVINSRHDDLEKRINREFVRVGDEDARLGREISALHETSMPRTEFGVWEKERTRTLDLMQRQIDQTTSRVETVIRDRASIEALSALQKQIDQLEKQLDALAVREDKRHGNN